MRVVLFGNGSSIGGSFSISWLAFASGVSLASSVNQSATVSGDTPYLSVMSFYLRDGGDSSVLGRCLLKVVVFRRASSLTVKEKTDSQVVKRLLSVVL
ncbi:hypothetical protein HID58_069507 [Brassica napus]|uniref:Secreted protein n=1 Tax=Brassica napus TaxID=3708 RepID=A0ABQ7YW63_BRANA|nr:hypothetical protein HID58_069507 [Brassica napus]